jgi:formylglycine-generating enzyme required for sulfatase activity
MSEFERGLAAARARQARFYLFSLIALVVVALGVAAVLVSTSATSIRILPAPAAETGAVAVVEGYSVVVGTTVYGVSRRPVVEVRAEGYRPQRRSLTPDERGRAVDVTLEPLPARLRVTTNHGEARTRWSLDGAVHSIGPALELELEAGTYRVAAKHPWFVPAEQSFEVARGEVYDAVLEPAPVAGRLSLASTPVPATVSINGAVVGETSITLDRPGGRYLIRLEATDRAVLEDEVEVTHTFPEVDRIYALRPLPAHLTFSVAPAGGELLVDGRRVAPSETLRVDARADHTVTYFVDGYRGARETVNLAPNEIRQVNLRLQPMLGTVEIHAAPDARILVDGRERGTGRATVELTAVPHKVVLEKPGYRSVTRTVTPRDGGRIVIRETLLTEAAARRAEAPRSYTNSVGIELVLFEPGPFTMGAPRHERGQRANEFERRIDLRQPFYAAKHEVTNAQYAKLGGPGGGVPNAPATGMSWEDAAAFANRLSAAEGYAPFYRMAGGRVRGVDPKSDGYRLLTEAEWEWLARAAGKPAQTVFPWGDSDTIPRGAGNIADEQANGIAPVFVPNYNDGYARIAPVGTFPAEASGLFDLAGNASEWVHDFHSLDPPDARTVAVDPLGPEFGDAHAIKGSSWRSGTRTTLRAAWRDGLSGSRDDVGFRIGRYLVGHQP